MKAQSFLLSVTAVLPLVVAQYIVPPPTTAPAGTISDCTGWVVAFSGESCQKIALQNSITLQQFEAYNPSVGASCQIVSGDSYCVQENYGLSSASSSSASSQSSATSSSSSSSSGSSSSSSATVTLITTTNAPTTLTTVTTTTTTTTRSTSTPANGVTTPSPIQSGMTSNCDKFYLVQSGDSCAAILAEYDISIATLYAWNPAVGSDCRSLWVGDYICVGIIGGAATTAATATATTTTGGNGIATPTPYQPGLTSNCDAFYLVQSGDSCAAILSQYSLSMATFYAWNPAVGSDCRSLWVSDYVCVGVLGQTTITTTTKPGNGISTPTPVQTGIASNCDKFYLVQSGDDCAAIAAQYGLTLSDFYAWNPAVGASCASLDVGDYVCVDVIGHAATPTTTTTTSAGNGIATPTPWEPGMVGNCNRFYYVESGDTCDSIAAGQHVSVAQITNWNPQVGSGCADLWLDTFICVGVV